MQKNKEIKDMFIYEASDFWDEHKIQNLTPRPSVNLGAGFEITIKDLVELIAKFTGFSGKVIWDTSKSDGQRRRMLDTTKAFTEFGFKAKTGFEEGLKKAIEWYREIKET